MVKIRCKECGIELESHSVKTQSCGCPNMATLKGDVITAFDLSKIVMITSDKQINRSKNVLSDSDLADQEARRNRKVRKMEFEIR